ncbi:hypothetical protein V8G54_005807 [Vigna mungo]|uniref:BHLH domain-containing protein n=1 Tax=Vigna mungo TaxID=3915 RepID=A0AAQ3NYW8_VIGMU
MSGRRKSRTSKFRESEINDLLLMLQALLPQQNQTSDSRVSVSMMQIMKETCSHISMLQKEIKELGERVAELVNSAYTSDLDYECLRTLLQHQQKSYLFLIHFFIKVQIDINVLHSSSFWKLNKDLR